MLTNIFLIQYKQLLLFEAGTFVFSSQSDQMFLIPFPQLFPVVLSSNLQMDTNFCISLTTYLSSNQQPTNGELPDQLVTYSKQKHFGTRSCMEICHTAFNANFTSHDKPCIDGHQLGIINAMEYFLFVTLQRINLFFTEFFFK